MNPQSAPLTRTVGTFTNTLAVLVEKGVKFSTVIDLGCADGIFFLQHYDLGLFRGTVPVNIDANPIYEDSLKAIKEVMGGHYVIAAVGDHAGETEFTQSVHPYWGSMRPPGDRYWEQHQRLHQEQTKVPMITLDSFAHQAALEPPFLIKLDVQGAEVAALRGAENVLRDTQAVICEALLDDFHAIHGALSEAGFMLFDLTAPNWLQDRTLGWFHPVYVRRELDHIRQRTFWEPSESEAVIAIQRKRREQILNVNANLLARERQSRRGG